jgi:hypothetical protein
MSDEDDYEVGYKQPPKHSRFKPGVSGNPKGRKKQPPEGRDVHKQVQEAFMREVQLREGEETRSATKVLALVEKTLADAINGNQKATALAYRMAQTFGVFTIKDRPSLDLSMLTPEERAVCDQALEYLRKARVFL